MPTASERLIANSQVQNSQRLIVEAGHNCDYIISPCAHAQVICFACKLTKVMTEERWPA